MDIRSLLRVDASEDTKTQLPFTFSTFEKKDIPKIQTPAPPKPVSKPPPKKEEPKQEEVENDENS